ncbi:Diacylglycerol acyltransferase/mycolyltransferase Ag85C precursor [Corynebacterium capitovis DSM 44611]|uniref:alpha/beta hydrolase-fold protein n=1 Tax=Corynebacterium capitovis TaxID=131081 RepID=UPI00037FB1FE|nr:alpha/beta hydrolase-fold protein [Corynebacterium capitovis]WKD58282.1 Diacylglycerol acyltransferase/mycolyltransferase Ag85C precursor [Corynebacterium capitovis DSM 44611]
MRVPRLGHPTARRAWIAAAAIPTAFVAGLTSVPAVAQSSFGGFSDNIRPSDPPVRTPVETESNPQIAGLPEGVSVERVDWLSSRRVAVFIRSAAMPEQLMQVQILLARDWHSKPTATFPEVWALDGLRARDDENGWTIETNIEQFYADKNVNVILPVGGESSFYSDWQRPDNGKNYKWETFLTRELIPVLQNKFRSNNTRAVVGLSMGGTAAVNLAERNPGLFTFVGSLSGYLDTTTPGMPQAIQAAQLDAGGYHSEAMWGQPGSQDWIDHDPKYGVESLKNMTVYVSSGSGRDDFGSPDSVAQAAASPAGVGLEVISRMSTQTFVDYANRAGVNPIVQFRPSGVHAWPYWQFEMTQAWPYIANAFKLSGADRGSDCLPIGAIADVTKGGIIGTCVNNEYDVAGGKAEDFRGGQAYWSPSTGAHALFGAILAKYNALGSAGGWLGFPRTGETATPDGIGRFVHFERGSIYWTPGTGAIAIPADMVTKWGTNGWEAGHLKYPVAEAEAIGQGLVQKFQGGYLTRNPNGTNNYVHGAIAAKYGELGTAKSALGYPRGEEIAINGGFFQEFEHGNIYFSPATGAHVIYYGGIFNKWGEDRWEQGHLGWPTSDQTAATGNAQITFQNGTIRSVNGKAEEVR